MARSDAFDDGSTGSVRKALPWIVGALALFGLIYGIYAMTQMTVGKEKKAPPTTTALLLPPPPPPPPPPPKEQPPEPVETTKPVPVETPTPTPQKADAPAAVSIDAASEAGGDAFGLQGGGPGGMGGVGSTGTGTGPVGGGIIDNFYGRNLARALQERVADDRRLARQVFTADFNIWIDGQGRVTRAVLVRDSNDGKRDDALKVLLETVRGLDPPPASLKFPQKITVRGQRSGSAFG